MRRALVTGADGFLGRHLLQQLYRRGVAVTAVGRRAFDAPGYVAMGDLPWSAERLAAVMNKGDPDAIFHLVGGAVGTPAELQAMNVGATCEVMQALVELHAGPCLICCGSAAEYGAAITDGVPVREDAICMPLSPYGMAKLAQTRQVLDFADRTGRPAMIARIFNPVGAGMPRYLALGDFAGQIAAMPEAGGTLETGNLHIYRDFIDVSHVAAILVKLVEHPQADGVVNVCSGVATELSELLDLLIAASGKTVRIRTSPARMRGHDPRVMVGSTARLSALGLAPPPTDYQRVVECVWQTAVTASHAS